MTRSLTIAALAIASLASSQSCGSAHVHPQVIIPPMPGMDVASFLAQLRCPLDGNLEIAEPNCLGARPQVASDPMFMRRHDWPAPAGYQIEDSFRSNDGSYDETTWAYPPFGPFIAANGDGGEVYVIDGGTVRISVTQDGGSPYIQGFFGAGCGGTGWVLFRSDAPTGSWVSLVATLHDEPLRSSCSAANSAFTRYRLEQVAIPFVIGGSQQTLTLPTIISEHYNAALIARATAMERTFMARGVGRAVWEAWTTGAPSSRDTAVRCPGTSWSIRPAAGWVLSDCRYSTNLVTADGSLSGDTYGWPARGVVFP